MVQECDLDPDFILRLARAKENGGRKDTRLGRENTKHKPAYHMSGSALYT